MFIDARISFIPIEVCDQHWFAHCPFIYSILTSFYNFLLQTSAGVEFWQKIRFLQWFMGKSVYSLFRLVCFPFSFTRIILDSHNSTGKNLHKNGFLSKFYPGLCHHRVWYPCDVHVIPMWCACDSHVMCMWYPCDVHVIPMWCTCNPHVMCMRFPCDVHVIPMWCTCDTHVMCMWYPCDVHVMCMWYPFDTNMM